MVTGDGCGRRPLRSAAHRAAQGLQPYRRDGRRECDGSEPSSRASVRPSASTTRALNTSPPRGAIDATSPASLTDPGRRGCRENRVEGVGFESGHGRPPDNGARSMAGRDQTPRVAQLPLGSEGHNVPPSCVIGPLPVSNHGCAAPKPALPDHRSVMPIGGNLAAGCRTASAGRAAGSRDEPATVAMSRISRRVGQCARCPANRAQPPIASGVRHLGPLASG